MKRLFLLALAAVLSIGAAVADDGVDISEKLSGSTQLFIMQRNEIYKKVPAGQRRQAMSRAQAEHTSRSSSLVSPAVCIDGQDMMMAFISIDEGHIGDLEALGVIVNVRAGDFVTALIPVDKIEAVAALPAVTHIKAATRLHTFTNKARTDSKVYDVINFTEAAQQAGLSTPYTGKGVVIGVIDSGIDFGHIAFRDKNGKSRIVKAYYTSSTDGNHTTVDYTNDENYSSPQIDLSHGTHTSSIAGGSSVIINGDQVTVTDDHASASYGGMAPEADLYLCDASEDNFNDIYVVEYLDKIFNYADSLGKPAVVNMSFGDQIGPHDGTGYVANYINQKANDGTHICVYGAGNDGNYDIYAYKENVTTQNNLNLLWNSATQGAYYDNLLEAYSRDKDVRLSARIQVIDTVSGDAVWDSGVIAKTTEILDDTTMKGITKYFRPYEEGGHIRVLISKDRISQKYSVRVLAEGMQSTQGIGIKDLYGFSRYILAVSILPYDANVSTTVDAWECTSCSFILPTHNVIKQKNYDFTESGNLCSITNDATCEDAISVGSYSVRNVITNFQGKTSRTWQTLDDIADYSSYEKAGYGPTGRTYPDITAPGDELYSAVNKTDTNYINGTSKPRINTNLTYPYGSMGGTSMAAPVVTGIIALWLQAAQENGITLDTKAVKEIMQATATRDEYTAAKPDEFGTQGKINALAGLQQILGMTGLDEKQVSDLATRDVESVHYVNLLGQSAAKPFPGLNIRVTTYSDGSTDAVKVRR